MINIDFFKKNKSKLVACSLAGVMSLGISGCNNRKKEDNPEMAMETVDITKFFDVGEHIISEPIDILEDVTQYTNNHPGYKCIDIAASNFSDYSFSDMSLIFTNTYPVDVKPTIEDNTLNYNNFGTPQNYSFVEKNIINNSKEFLPGEHNLIVRLEEKNIAHNQTFKNYDGYEIIGICYTSPNFPFVLYTNKEKVICEVTEYDKNGNPKFLEFGTPVEKEKSLTLEKPSN